MVKKILSLFPILILFFSFRNVYATTYTLENRATNFYFYPSSSSPSITNNQLYYNGNSNDFLYHMDIGLNTISSDRDDKNNNVFNGRYFIDFYIFGVGTFPDIPCWSLTEVRAQYLNKTDAIWYSMPISCVDTYKTTYKGYNAIRFLFEFTYKDKYGSDGMSELNFILGKSDGFIVGGSTGLNYGYNFGSIQTYNQQILDDFINLKNQNDLINNDKVTQDKIDNIDDTITDNNVDTPNFEEFEEYITENGVITQLITLPVRLYTQILNNINTSCTPFVLGDLFGHNLVMNCINPSDFFGSTLWNIVDILGSGLFIYAISKKMVAVFHQFTNLEEGDILD